MMHLIMCHTVLWYLHSNELPAIEDSSDGFARKMQLIHFGNKFEGAKKDKSVDTIQYDDVELSGVFNLLLPIINRIVVERGLEYEDDVSVIKNKWLKRSDSVYSFVSEYIELYPGGVHHGQELQASIPGYVYGAGDDPTE